MQYIYSVISSHPNGQTVISISPALPASHILLLLTVWCCLLSTGHMFLSIFVACWLAVEQDGSEIRCDTDFSLLKAHVCGVKAPGADHETLDDDTNISGTP